MQKNKIRKSGLFNSDLYQFTCSYAYFISGNHQKQATFEFFFRKYPFGGEYVIFGGLQSVHDFILNASFEPQHEQYLKKMYPEMKTQYFKWLTIQKKIQVRSMKQGQIAFAQQPLITLSGPLGFIQLFETPILNLIGFASLVATNASRMVKAVGAKKCLEFGTRRAQGPDGALSASQYAYLGGFVGTSNVQVGRMLNIPCNGTMSHAYITSFSSLEQVDPFTLKGIQCKSRALEIKKQLNINSHMGELASFLMYAKAFPSSFTALIDTYNTIQSGLLNTIIVAKILLQLGQTKFGIRLDSGDLCEYSKKCRKLWKKYLPQIDLTIIASDDLYQERLLQLQNNGSEIDIYAIGTNIATCKRQPALGLVCKLVELSRIPKVKLSEDSAKSTLPCEKNVYRIYRTTQDKADFDLIGLANEIITSPVLIIDPNNRFKKISTQFIKCELINEKWGTNPQIKTIKESKQFYDKNSRLFDDKIFQLLKPKHYMVFMTNKFMEVVEKCYQENSVIQYLKSQ